MRILYVVTGLKMGGAERQVATLCRAMADKGHEVAVASLIERSEGEVALPSACVRYSLDMQPGVPDIGSIARLKGIVARFRPDVVHAHMIHANLLCRASRPFSRMPRLICTAHSDIETRSKALRLAYRISDQLCDLTTNVSDAAVAAFVRQGIAPSKRIVRVYDCIETERLAATRRLREARDAGRRFCFVGRLEPEKGTETLAKAVKIAAGALGGGFGLDVVGEGSQRKRLESEIGDIPGVKFHGLQNDPMSACIGADFILCPSMHEGFGMALVEGAISGMFPIATACAGPEELIKTIGFGMVTPLDDPQAFAEAIVHVSRDPQEHRAAVLRLAPSIERFFSAETIGTVWLHVYGGGRP